VFRLRIPPSSDRSNGPLSRAGGIRERVPTCRQTWSRIAPALITDRPTMKNPWGATSSAPVRRSGSRTPRPASPRSMQRGNPQPLQVAIPAPASALARAPSVRRTGKRSTTLDPNSTNRHLENEKSGPSFFVFAAEDGTIRGWNRTSTKANAVHIAVDRFPATAAPGTWEPLKGLTLVSTPRKGKFIYANELPLREGRRVFGHSLQPRQQLSLTRTFRGSPPSYPTASAGNLVLPLRQARTPERATNTQVLATLRLTCVSLAPNATLIQRLVTAAQARLAGAVDARALQLFGPSAATYIRVGTLCNGRIHATSTRCIRSAPSASGRATGRYRRLLGTALGPHTPGAGPNNAVLLQPPCLNNEARRACSDTPPQRRLNRRCGLLAPSAATRSASRRNGTFPSHLNRHQQSSWRGDPAFISRTSLGAEATEASAFLLTF